MDHTDSGAHSNSGRRPGLIRRALGALGSLCALGAAAFFLFGECARLVRGGQDGPLANAFALAEIASQVRFPFGQLVAVGTLLLLVLGRWKSALVSGLVVALCLVPELRLSFGDRDEAPAGESLRVVAANVLRSNDRYAEVFDAVLAEEPDVVGLLEISAVWRERALERLSEDYPHVVEGMNTEEWDETSWGSMIFSKVPFTSSEAIRIAVRGWVQRPPLEVVLDTADGPLTVQLMHPELPGPAYRLRARLAQLEPMADRKGPGERMVVGDLNTTSTSPLFGRLLERSELRDSRVGFGRQPTWNQIPGQVPGAIAKIVRRVWVPGFAIDHALVSPGLAVIERRTIAIPGSDHRAVVVDVRPAIGD